jgi:hypothetical protein
MMENHPAFREWREDLSASVRALMMQNFLVYPERTFGCSM